MYAALPTLYRQPLGRILYAVSVAGRGEEVMTCADVLSFLGRQQDRSVRHAVHCGRLGRQASWQAREFKQVMVAAFRNATTTLIRAQNGLSGVEERAFSLNFVPLSLALHAASFSGVRLLGLSCR